MIKISVNMSNSKFLSQGTSDVPILKPYRNVKSFQSKYSGIKQNSIYILLPFKEGMDF